MINSQRVEISQTSFPAKNLLKQTTYLLLEAKKPLTLFERTLTVNNEAQKRQQAFIQIILHCDISIFVYLCRVEYKINVNCQTSVNTVMHSTRSIPSMFLKSIKILPFDFSVVYNAKLLKY